MKGHMKYIIDHAEEIEKLIKVKAQVSEVKSIMLENIDKVLYSSGVRFAIYLQTALLQLLSSVQKSSPLPCVYNTSLCVFRQLIEEKI